MIFDANLNINLAIEIDRDMATSLQAAGRARSPTPDRRCKARSRKFRRSHPTRTTASSAGTTSTPDSNPAAYLRLAHLPTF
jgi:hypothetical protein